MWNFDPIGLIDPLIRESAKTVTQITLLQAVYMPATTFASPVDRAANSGFLQSLWG
jgi:hypothetical protein